MKICANCINKINQAFSFAKLCEATDIILRECVARFKTGLSNNFSQSQKVETEKEINLPNTQRAVIEIWKDYDYVEEFKLEEDLKIVYEEYEDVILEEDTCIEYEEHMNEDKQTDEEYVEEAKQEDVLIEYDEIYDAPEDKRYEEDIHQDQNQMYSEESDNFGTRFRRGSTNYQRKRGRSNVLSKRRIKYTGELTYDCKVCGKVLKSIKTLHIHKRIHTGEKPNVCCTTQASYII